MSFDRYAPYLDAYTLQEFRYSYEAAPPNGRVRLLHRLYKSGNWGVPYEIALLAVTDPNVEVRRWIARHGRHLDYRPWKQRAPIDGLETERPFPERNLIDRLKADTDPFVRAALRENPEVFSRGLRVNFGLDWFSESTPLERLALVRNPNVGLELIERIFDLEDRELGIDIEARVQLIRAFLTNDAVIRRSHETEEPGVIAAVDAWYDNRRRFSNLWKLIARWPDEHADVPHAVFEVLGADDQAKAEAFRTCTNLRCRSIIVEKARPDDVETLQAAIKDGSDLTREHAAERLNFRHKAIVPLAAKMIDAALSADDKGVPQGLARNRTLPAELAKKVAGHGGEWDFMLENRHAKRAEREKQWVLEDPDLLFRNRGNLEEKIDFIGRTVLRWQWWLKEICRMLVAFAVVVAGMVMLVRLFRWLLG